MTKSNKFDGLNKTELLQKCLEQEDELVKLRPKPAKFRLGQIVAGKNPNWSGQTHSYFKVLSVEYKYGQWSYGYATAAGGKFQTRPEEELRALSITEMDGTPEALATPAAVPTQIVGQPGTTAPQVQFDPGGGM